jgi:hypothetical protein
MTETSTFPSGVAQADEGMGIMPPDVGSDESSGGSDRRRLIMLIGAVVGVLVLAGAAYMLMHKSGSSSPSSGSVPKGVFQGAPKTTSSKTIVVKKSHVSTKPRILPRVQHHPQGRDPFAPLITAPVTTGATAASSSTVSSASSSTSTSTTSSTTNSTPTTPVTQPTSGKTTTKGNGKTSSQPQWIQLVSVQGHMANFKVGYAHHKFRLYAVQEPHASATAGTVFDKEFALIGIVNGGATVQIGDGTPFLLTPGIARVV